MTEESSLEREHSGSDNESLAELGWSRDELSFVELNGEEKMDTSPSTREYENPRRRPASARKQEACAIWIGL